MYNKGFKKFAKDMDKAGIEWWLMYGSLLGAVREEGIIKGETDIDIGVFDQKAFKVTDSQWVHAPNYWNVQNNNMIINVQKWDVIGNKMYHILPDGTLQQQLSYPICFKKAKFEGVWCDIPCNYEELLKDWFSDWTKPMDQKARTHIYQITHLRDENPW